MGKEFVVRDSERLITQIENEGFTYAGAGGRVEKNAGSRTIGWFYPPQADWEGTGVDVPKNLGYLMHGGTLFGLCNEDAAAQYANYHKRIEEALRKDGNSVIFED
jgi:hypothetical protein